MVGGQAVSFHAQPRATKDLDIFDWRRRHLSPSIDIEQNTLTVDLTVKLRRREEKSRTFNWLARYSLELSAYLHRIRFEGGVRPDLATLRAIHRAHQYAIPFENLDVLLRRPVVLDLEANYDKIVCQRRGGWCYEMNG